MKCLDRFNQTPSGLIILAGKYYFNNCYFCQENTISTTAIEKAVHNIAIAAELLSIPLNITSCGLCYGFWYSCSVTWASHSLKLSLWHFSQILHSCKTKYVFQSVLTKQNNSKLSKQNNILIYTRGKCSVRMETFFKFLGYKIL